VANSPWRHQSTAEIPISAARPPEYKHRFIPSAVDPPIVGAGRRPGRHLRRALTWLRALAARAVVCSASPGSTADGDGSAQPPAHRDAPYGVPTILGPEIPAGGKRARPTAACHSRNGAAWTAAPRAQLAAAGPAPGPTLTRCPWRCPFVGGSENIRCPRQPMGVGLGAAERQRQRRPGARSAARAARFGPP
jgi:hypothetical protein